MDNLSESQINTFEASTLNEEPQLEEALRRINDCKASQSKTLDLENLHLKELPKEINDLVFLENLNLRENPLEILNIENLNSLVQIELSGVKFNKLPDNFSNLKNLRKLFLSGKNIKKFPKQILSLTQLVSLNLSECKIPELPEKLNTFENLETLWLLCNPIKSIAHLSPLLSRITHLSVNETRIVDYAFLNLLKRVENLSLGNKTLMAVPTEVFNLTSLIRLHISDSPIETIPSEIGNLQKLETFAVFITNVKRIPDSIGTLKNLRELWLVSNSIECLPITISNLNKLTHLILYRNSIQEIPSEVGRLTNLIRLDLHRNKLVSLPIELGKLVKLEELDVTDNNLVVLPPELSQLASLRKFHLRDNPSLISPPKHTIEKGTEAVLSYLKDLIEEVKVWSSKLVIVGEGQVGKSCLLDSLEGKPFQKGKSTTHALNLSQIKFEHSELDCEMYLNVWDFGGQDIYHATHQFYLTNHSLFLLAWSARSGYEAGKIYRWLETISALAPDSPIFIVATNSSARGADLPKGDIINQYKDKVSFFDIDNEKGTGINELKEAIRIKASKLKYMGIGRPKSWINSSSEIKQTDGQYLAKKELFNIFYKNGVSKESYESLASYLHDLGEILYYPEEEELNETIIIKPEWVSKQIAKILDSKELSENEGFLNKKHLQVLWADIDTSIHDKLITLMEKFDLSYKTKDDKEISLIVEKLKHEEHESYQKIWEEFDGANEIVFKYQLDTIPAGIPTWFIARTHRFSIKVHWKSGALLKDPQGKHLGLLITSLERKEIWLRVKGEMPYYFFAQLRDTLELTFNRFEGLKRPAFVPCPGHDGTDCSHLFELKQLEKRLLMNPPKQSIECPEAVVDVDVMKLIFGLSFAPNNDILVEKIRNEVSKLIKAETQVQTTELIKFIQLEFIKSYHSAQEIADITCPNIFTLKEIKSNIKGIEFNDKYKLQLYCQMPGCNHPVGEPYDVKMPKKWLNDIAPYYNNMLKVLKYTLPLAVPGIKSILEESEFDTTKPYIDSIKEYNRVFNETKNDAFDPSKTSDMSIKAIKNMLVSVDPSNTWAGLKRLVSPEGHILWLCKEHFEEYKN